jgi:hypothetical protein
MTQIRLVGSTFCANLSPSWAADNGKSIPGEFLAVSILGVALRIIWLTIPRDIAISAGFSEQCHGHTAA